ncbi:MAG: extracellular solute-binding protein [Chitinivibrionales bacterium]|nr:extracellular solute-binding protein [Chitinivibrionales bacterium]MBD3395394.1 extracellular solute-binding protein [Chitinivibrionales bacterium]
MKPASACIRIALLMLSSCVLIQARSKVEMKVLIRMLDAQEAFFKAEVIEGFESKPRSEIEVVHYASVDSIPLELEKHTSDAGLVKVPFDKAWSLVDQGHIKPLNDFLTEEQMKEFGSTYLLTSLGMRGGKQYYVPRKFETRVMVYLKSRVKEACAVWRMHHDAVSAELKKYNGYGLPATYMLEDDPNAWDFFDVFVAGWVWAHTQYGGTQNGRVAHRGKRYSGTALRVIDRAFSCGADSAAIIDMHGDAVRDAFLWEAAYAASGIYNPRMWKQEWSGSGVWEGFKDGDVFLSFMTQLDCFFIHGTGRDGLEGFLKDPDDMGVAVMPAGCSLDIDKTGKVAREGSHAITTGGWWWGIPVHTPDALVSYKVARHITSTENQVQGCSRFGMIPVRKDILSDMSMLFGGGWITEVYDVSFKQLMANKKTVLPSHPKFDKIRDVYLDAWFDIVVNRNWAAGKSGGTPDAGHIESVLSGTYRSQVDKLK